MSDLPTTDLVVSVDAGVLSLHINREPRRNALNGEVLGAMLAALRDVGDARVVLVTSAPLLRLGRRREGPTRLGPP